MDIPFSNRYNWLMPTRELLEGISAAKTREEQERMFLDYLSDAEGSYEFYGMVWGNYDMSDYPIDVPGVILDYIVKSKDKWNPDEVACFLLEVAEDHSKLGGHTDWLIEVDLPGMLELDYAGTAIWEMFWGECDHLIMELINHYQWNSIFAKKFDERWQSIDPHENPDDYYFYYALARIVESGESSEPIGEAGGLAEGLQAKEEGLFYDAISTLLEFHEEFPNTIPQEIRTTLAICYLETGWRGLALEWVMQALKHDADNPEIQELQKRILSDDMEQLQRLEKELESQFDELTPESVQALTLAEFLYRYHGWMLHDYAAVISGYARAVEVQLKQCLLPKVRKWIQAYGAVNELGRRWIRAGNDRIYKDARFTFGTWSTLFDEEKPHNYRLTAGEFYYCIHKEYGATISFGNLSKFGKLLNELRKLRNLASHEVVNDWSKVRRAREILFVEKLFNLLSSTTGSMFAS